MLPQKIAFVDLETTGTSATRGRILEIGILRVENNILVKTFKTLLNPECYIPPEIERLTGISAKDIEDAPTFYQIKDELLEILHDCIFVAHNVRFDYSFLRNEFLRLGITFQSKHFCTVKLSRALYPMYTHHNLDAIIERNNFHCQMRHRAFDDAEVLFKFYQKVQQEFPEDVLLKAVNTALRRPSLPLKLKQEDLDTLPELPGIYIFYGENGTPLYVGKSINIRDRVLSHFSGDIHSPTEMKISQQIESIETQVTAGELGALFTESQTIKKLLPLYNKKLRLKRELVALRTITTPDGYHAITQEVIQQINIQHLESYVGFFRSRRQAKQFLSHVAKEYNLCEKLLGLEKTTTDCFAHRLEVCKGACIKKELPLKYNMRHIEAFSRQKINPWPFPGPILIEEKNPLTQKSEQFIIDTWCFLGSITQDNNNAANPLYSNDKIFDLDLYKILLSYLRSPDNLKKIKQLKKDELQLLLPEDTNTQVEESNREPLPNFS